MILHIVVVALHHGFFFFAFLFGNGFHEFGIHSVESVVAFVFAHERFGNGVNLVVSFFIDTLAQLFVVMLVAVLAFWIGFLHFGSQIQLSLALDFDSLVGEIQRIHHILLGDFLHLAFHHHDVVHRSGHDHVDVGIFHLLHGRVDHHLTIHTAYSHFGDRSFEGDIGYCQC